MRGWNHLPPETKQEVIKNLDLMSRQAMRCTSRTERSIVDSTKFYIPRVRFAIKDEHKCMIMIYTGIEKFLRMELYKGSSDGTVIHKMENSYDLKDATIKEIPSSAPIQLASSILKNLLIHKSILLGTVEFEFAEHDENRQDELFDDICIGMQKLKNEDNRFRTKKLIGNSYIAMNLNYCRSFCDLKVLEEEEVNKIEFHRECLFPRKVVDANIFSENATTLDRQTHMWMEECHMDTVEQLFLYGNEVNRYATCRFPQGMDDEKKNWEYLNLPVEKLNKKVQMKRLVSYNGGVVFRFNKSECGVWMHMMKIEEETKYLDYFEKETCGLRWLCKKCTDPFEYWFYQTLPRRLYHEPDWIDIGLQNEPEEMMALLELFIEDERKKSKETSSIQKKLVKSWGFRNLKDKKKVKVKEKKLDSDEIEEDSETKPKYGLFILFFSFLYILTFCVYYFSRWIYHHVSIFKPTEHKVSSLL